MSEKEQKEIIVREFLEELASKNSCTDEDCKTMERILRKIGLPKAVCVLGIVYLEGQGTIDAPPLPINMIAKMLLLQAKLENKLEK